MTTRQEKFSSQADAQLLSTLRDIAKTEGRHFQAVLEDAMRDYVENRSSRKPRPSAMAHFQAGVSKNRRLGKLLAQ